MNTFELKGYLRTICKKGQYDVIPCDELDRLNIIRYPLCLIVNTDPSDMPGDHWISIYIESKTSMLEYYDSYGNGINFYSIHFINFAKRLKRDILENIVRLQSYNSTVCGYYALYFLCKRIQGCEPKTIYCKFSINDKRNDKLVKTFIISKIYLSSNNCCSQNNQCCTLFNK
jgi:hypothetical protein